MTAAMPPPQAPMEDLDDASQARRSQVLRASVGALFLGALFLSLAAGLFIGHSTASPSSLADAFKQTANGSLPRGDITGVLRSGGLRTILGGGTAGGDGGVAGTVSGVNGNTLTVTTTAGQVKVVVSNSTTYQKSASASLTDVSPGTRVSVRPDFTTSNTRGSINAATVTIQLASATGQ
jgi:hypothetical protein